MGNDDILEARINFSVTMLTPSSCIFKLAAASVFTMPPKRKRTEISSTDSAPLSDGAVVIEACKS